MLVLLYSLSTCTRKATVTVAEEISQSIQAPFSTHAGTTYPVRTNPHSDLRHCSWHFPRHISRQVRHQDYKHVLPGHAQYRSEGNPRRLFTISLSTLTFGLENLQASLSLPPCRFITHNQFSMSRTVAPFPPTNFKSIFYIVEWRLQSCGCCTCSAHKYVYIVSCLKNREFPN